MIGRASEVGMLLLLCCEPVETESMTRSRGEACCKVFTVFTVVLA